MTYDKTPDKTRDERGLLVHRYAIETLPDRDWYCLTHRQLNCRTWGRHDVTPWPINAEEVSCKNCLRRFVKEVE